MANPGFRTGGGGGPGSQGSGPGGGGGLGGSGLPGSPFSQAQILHLMKAEFARARRHGLPLACLVIQIDRIAFLADYHGLELKSRLLKELGRLVSEKTRGADNLGLITDDRYLLLLPHTTEAQAEVVAERIRCTFAELVVESQGVRIPTTLSLGAAAADPQTLFFDTLISQAEVAAEWAASAGGDQTVPFQRDRYLKLHPEGGPAESGSSKP